MLPAAALCVAPCFCGFSACTQNSVLHCTSTCQQTTSFGEYASTQVAGRLVFVPCSTLGYGDVWVGEQHAWRPGAILQRAQHDHYIYVWHSSRAVSKLFASLPVVQCCWPTLLHVCRSPTCPCSLIGSAPAAAVPRGPVSCCYSAHPLYKGSRVCCLDVAPSERHATVPANNSQPCGRPSSGGCRDCQSLPPSSNASPATRLPGSARHSQ
jgi:hypothetical protein